MPRYHSKRLALSLPLPYGHEWRIDDRSRPELVALHPPTQSRVLVAIVRADSLVGRTECEQIARDRKLVPARPMEVVEEETAITQENFDTRIRVALEPTATVSPDGGTARTAAPATASGPPAALVGHVMAFGGFLRKCYVFDFTTRVDGAKDEPALSARLAFARARILGGMKLDPFATPGRDAEPGVPVGPLVAPARP